MIERIVEFSVRRRWLVLLATLLAAASGFWSLTRLPIDAVPDVTNVQVQVNAVAPALTPVEIEKQVTVALEAALAGIPGIADAIGGFVKQFQVQPDPARLIGYGLAFGQVIAAIEANKGSRGAGYIEQNGESLVVRAAARVENLDDISNIVLATRGGVVVRVSDVAAVAIGRELRTGSASVDGREVVLGPVLMLTGDNSRTVAAAADARITEIRRTFAA